MLKYLSKTAIIFVILTFIARVWDKDNLLALNLDNKTFYFDFSLLLFYLFVFIIGFEFLVLGLKGVVRMLKNDVLISNHAFFGEKDSIEMMQEDETDQIVLSRNQFDAAALIIVKALSSITSGLTQDARKHLDDLRAIIGDDAIIDILMMKIYKAEKNFDKMGELSQKLMQNEDIQLVGMKAALEAQVEKKEFNEALQTVNQAFGVRQDLYWVIGSAFLLRARSGDWSGALEVLQAGIDKNITPEPKARRLKAVALYELAKQAKDSGDKTNYFKFITQALNENNKLVPAALDLAEYYIKNDQQKQKAQSVLYDMWVNNPTYEVAQAYLKLYPKDSHSEKIQRLEKMALANSKRPSLNNLLLAELYIKYRKFAKAKTECKMFLLKNPATTKMVELLHEMRSKQLKNKKVTARVKKEDIALENCPKDFQWMCAKCRHTSDKWEPICPKCGEIGRSYWHLYIDNQDSETDA